MTTFDIFPGEGIPILIDYGTETATWAVTAVLLFGSQEITPAPVCERVDSGTWRVRVTKDHSLALTGKRARLKITAVDPDEPDLPEVDEVAIIVAPN
jgi:hypothetical protein